MTRFVCWNAAKTSVALWLIASTLATMLLAFAAAYAPARIRLIGLFLLAFGLLIGWLVARLAVACDAAVSRRMTIVVAVFVAFAGAMVATWETARLEESRRTKSGNEGLAERLIRELEIQMPASKRSSPGIDALATFRQHLHHRVRQLGDWASPWPEVFWVTELIAAAIASGWASTRTESTDQSVIRDRER